MRLRIGDILRDRDYPNYSILLVEFVPTSNDWKVLMFKTDRVLIYSMAADAEYIEKHFVWAAGADK